MKLNIGNEEYITEQDTHMTLKVHNEMNTYKILESQGDLQEKGYVVLNNIHVNPQHTAEFENRFFKPDDSLRRNRWLSSAESLKT